MCNNFDLISMSTSKNTRKTNSNKSYQITLVPFRIRDNNQIV